MFSSLDCWANISNQRLSLDVNSNDFACRVESNVRDRFRLGPWVFSIADGINQLILNAFGTGVASTKCLMLKVDWFKLMHGDVCNIEDWFYKMTFLPGNRCKSFTGWSLDPCNRCAPASSWFADGILAFGGAISADPHSTKWEAQFIALAQCFGGWSAGPSRHTQPTRRSPANMVTGGCNKCCWIRYSWRL